MYAALSFLPALCYIYTVNVILFEQHETGKPLHRRDERAIHLLKVLHKKAGDTFDAGILTDIEDARLLDGGLCTGTIEKIGIDGSLAFSLAMQTPALPRLPIRVGVGFPRPIQIRRLLRDLSSLGVEAVDFFGTELGEKSYRDTKLFSDGGARAALIEGAAQSRDTTIPRLSVFNRLEDWLNSGCLKSSEHALLIVADNVRPEGAMSQITHTKQPVVLAIGPERGWSDRERDVLEEAGFLRLSLGRRALRTETACVTATVLAIDIIGEMG